MMAERMDDGWWYAIHPAPYLNRKEPRRYRGRLARFDTRGEMWEWSCCPHSHPTRAHAWVCSRALAQERNSKLIC